MSNVNPRKVDTLLSYFNELDNKRQREIIKRTYILTVEQQVESELKEKTKRLPDRQELEYATKERLKDLNEFAGILLSLDETGVAAIAMMMEKLHPTSMTKEQSTTVTTTHTSVDLRNKLKECLPNANLSVAQSIVTKTVKHYK